MAWHRWTAAAALALALAVTALPLAPEASPAKSGEILVEYDEPPVPVSTPAPEYPKEARERGCEGTVMLRVILDVNGATTIEEVVREVDGCPELTRVARDAVSRWRYQPAKKDGKPVSVQVYVPVKFSLRAE